MITVEKLIKILENLENQKAVVILSRDSEGNNFRPLAKDVSPQYEFTKRGDLVEEGEGGRPCLVLWPE